MKGWIVAVAALVIEKVCIGWARIFGPKEFRPNPVAPVAPPPIGPIPDGPPQLPIAFYGQARFNGRPVPIGTEICAIVAGVKYPVLGNPTKVYDSEGRFGGPTLNEPKLVVQGPGIRAGARIRFYIGNWPCWCGGEKWNPPHVDFPFGAGDVKGANLWLGGGT